MESIPASVTDRSSAISFKTVFIILRFIFVGQNVIKFFHSCVIRHFEFRFCGTRGILGYEVVEVSSYPLQYYVGVRKNARSHENQMFKKFKEKEGIK